MTAAMFAPAVKRTIPVGMVMPEVSLFSGSLVQMST